MNSAADAFETAHAHASRDWGTIAAWVVIGFSSLYMTAHLLAWWLA